MSPRTYDLSLFWAIASTELFLSVLRTPFLYIGMEDLDYIEVFYHYFVMISAAFLIIGLRTGDRLLFLPSAAFHALMAMVFLWNIVDALRRFPNVLATASTAAARYANFPYWPYLLGHTLEVVMSPIMAIICLVIAGLIYYQGELMEEARSRNIDEANTVRD